MAPRDAPTRPAAPSHSPGRSAASGRGTLAAMPGDEPTSDQRRAGRLAKAIGPGVLFAGAAIGVSHLVQSTRAGAVYGLSLIPLVLLAHGLKYPALVFGPRYAIATGRSLPEAYRDQGAHAIGLFALVLLGTMFTIMAAVTIVTASIVSAHVVDPLLSPAGLGRSPPIVVAAGLLGAGALIIALGGFGSLDKALKTLMVVMLVSTLIAAGLRTPALLGAGPAVWSAGLDPTDGAWLAFAVALVGWMPAPLDISSWHSLWTLERIRQTGVTPTGAQGRADFLIGYALCIVLAVAFVALGAALLFARDVEPERTGGAFALQLVSLYTEALGGWARPLIVACAVAVMFSTTLTVFDGLSRTAAATWRAATPRPPTPGGGTQRGRLYWIMGGLIVLGALLLIGRFQDRLAALVDLATTLSFVGTPVIAWFNHRAMLSDRVTAAHRPGPRIVVWSWVGIVFWSGFAAVFLAQQALAVGG